MASRHPVAGKGALRNGGKSRTGDALDGTLVPGTERATSDSDATNVAMMLRATFVALAGRGR